MTSIPLLYPQIVLITLITLSGCSNVEQIRETTPEQLLVEIKTLNSDTQPGLRLLRAPDINDRAGFGKFSASLLTGGGASFGNLVHLQARETGPAAWDFEFVASIQYTNLGGVYRRYNRASIEGAPELVLTTIDMKNEFNS